MMIPPIFARVNSVSFILAKTGSTAEMISTLGITFGDGEKLRPVSGTACSEGNKLCSDKLTTHLLFIVSSLVVVWQLFVLLNIPLSFAFCISLVLRKTVSIFVLEMFDHSLNLCSSIFLFKPNRGLKAKKEGVSSMLRALCYKVNI